MSDELFIEYIPLSQLKRYPRNAKDRSCAHCGAAFHVTFPSSKVRFCTHQCAMMAKRKPLLTCEHCSTPFSRESGAMSRFCSKKCWYSWHQGTNNSLCTKLTITCEWCGIDFERNPFEAAKVKHHYCSQTCSAKAHSLKMRGIAEGEPQSARHYSLAHWRRIRLQAIARDGGCVDCGMAEADHRIHWGASISVDHIIPRREGGTDELSNLQCLCRRCHSKKTNRGK